MLKQWIKRKKRGTKKEENKPRWEADYELVENEGLFQEYLEMSESFKRPIGISFIVFVVIFSFACKNNYQDEFPNSLFA